MARQFRTVRVKADTEQGTVFALNLLELVKKFHRGNLSMPPWAAVVDLKRSDVFVARHSAQGKNKL